jgi:hypothetical protein
LRREKMAEKYNGWTNYETWNVALWTGNDEGLYNMVREGQPYTVESAQALAVELFPSGTPDMDSAADLFKVDWPEIVECWNEY